MDTYQINLNYLYFYISVDCVNLTPTDQGLRTENRHSFNDQFSLFFQRITETAEESMEGHVFDPNLQVCKTLAVCQTSFFRFPQQFCVPTIASCRQFDYNDAKTLNREGSVQLPLVQDRHFHNIPVNVNQSAIHVPTNVFNRGIQTKNDDE